jgi:4'-phosphopantetheinyl transferase
MNIQQQTSFLLFDNMSQCTDSEVERLLSLVSAQRREVALRYKFTFGRFTCLKSYVMLQQLVQEVLAETDKHWLTLQQRLKEWNGDFVFNEHDKPFMQNALGQRIKGVDFSISHCKNAIAVALSDRPLGVDVESFRHAEGALLRRTMNPEEQAEVLAATDPAEAFTRFWTRKEAVLKLRGTGLVDNLHEVLTNLENIQLETTVNKNRQYACTLAVYLT